MGTVYRLHEAMHWRRHMTVTLRQNLDRSAGAIFGGEAEEYRYLLWRGWLGQRTITWLMCNPSVADELVLDSTLRRCWSFSEKWGFGRMEIVNLFAFRATEPKVMKAVAGMGVDVIGPRNDDFILHSAISAERVVCGWGMNDFGGRGDVVVNMLTMRAMELFALKVTKDGAPGHPLYVKGDTELTMYKQAAW